MKVKNICYDAMTCGDLDPRYTYRNEIEQHVLPEV